MNRRRTYNIAMVSDFFFPQPGGVESHIYQLSTKLVDRGHKVIIITHAYGDRTGVRWLTNGIKVYYCPFLVIFRSATFPTVFSFFPLFRNIILRENIDIVHGHQSLSNLCHEAILHARTMGIRTVFTDHSLFGFADAGSILTNKLLKFTLSDVDHVVCVSHTCKENTVLRASLDPSMVSVIPNAVVSDDFQPLNYKPAAWQQVTDQHQSNLNALSRSRQPSGGIPAFGGPKPAHLLGPSDPIIIVVVSRLFYNKGTDLLITSIPRILLNHPNTRFIIAGDGPKGIDLEQMIEQNVLQDKVQMLGSIRHEEVRDVMVRGHIYLHPSLTEAFGTVIVEAASCGLYVVCTQVGGIPEVLPSHMTIFAKPEEDDLVMATSKAINAVRNNKVRTERFHEEVKKMYSWQDIAVRTERVYRGISGDITDREFYGPQIDDWQVANDRNRSFALIDRLKRYYGCGTWAGKLFCVCVIVDYLLFMVLEWLYPREKIHYAIDWPRKPPPDDYSHDRYKR
ncbi:Phosphatidylinositol N-acetylglucosaminyltransferase gpi3 subunit [Zalerion maritima]|uniref:Phosphatidylinositol N-acetylglucosaminyltransferase GPI3 subunit n=1 Tax=Zalerion maritima TaxID=339359 RepID=A0AAD5RWB1_9PEZI|nr:Phosphatidylinositol N-acetylglucosaminyltransferase gpi3 subunit [Zalerion maritima]